MDRAIALTGSIGTGKSTVCSLLKLHGYTVLDLDKISHEVIENIHSEIIDLFGESVVSGGKVDRKAIAKIVFNSPAKLRELESIIHPLIKKEVIKRSKKLDTIGINYFIDIPLFFEKRGSYNIKKSVVVYCPKETQIQRVMKRDNIDYNEALKRINLQMDIDKKAKMTDYLIDNSGDIGALTKEVDSFVRRIKGDSQ